MHVRYLIVIALLLLSCSLAAAESYDVSDVIISGNDRVSIASVRSVIKILPGQSVTSDIPHTSFYYEPC